jgi:drug/metabolite transporter (DMT)-like permease
MTRSRQLLLMSLHVSLAAGTYVLAKLAVDGFPSAAALTLARALGTTLLLLLLSGTLIPWPDFDGPTWAKLFGLGVLLVPVNQYLFLRGLEDSVPGHSALLYALTPAGILLLTSVVERRAPSGRKLLGVLVALAGAIVVMRPWEQGDAAKKLRHGDLLLLLAVVAWVFYTVGIRSLCRTHDARSVTAWSLILGTLAAMPIGAREMKLADWSAVARSAWAGYVWLVVVTSVVMMLLWSHLLRHLHAVEVAICMNAQPPATALLQWTLSLAGFWSAFGLKHVDEPLGATFFAGMALVLVGVGLVQQSATRVVPPPPAETEPVEPA